ncbi:MULTISPECIES: mechanosensitive ion channel family protein [Chelativorans]|jgi:MscS family membrane protein|uniref:MscS Mechanosensitive ion channel n=1 Tax=Chelativorans sp. (strain BNC1) TaxID=266779 RepID=Q11I79_CHESB|nr:MULTISPECIES: mechanosensitive ion channel family protein [Chelativorans]
MRTTAVAHSLWLLLFWVLIQPHPASAQSHAGDPSYIHADLASPQDTLNTFLSSTEKAAALMLEAYSQRQAEGGLFPSDSVEEKVTTAELLLDTAARTLDLSNVPPAAIAHEKMELVLRLKEVLEEISLPPQAEIPDEAALEQAHAADRPITRWRIPGTELVMVQVAEGGRSGDFVFSADTVSRIPDLYNALVAAPERFDRRNIYEFFSLSPGRLLPPFWYDYILAGPDWLNFSLADQAAWPWLALIVWMIVSATVLLWIVRKQWGVRRADGAKLNLIERALLPVALIALSAFFLFEVIDQINLTGRVFLIANAAGQVLLAFGLSWLIVLICQSLAELIISSPSILPDSLDAHLLRAGFRVLGLGLALILLGHTATTLGIPLLGLIAGLGVGGLAIALAAQPTIENFIGGVILFADRPVRMGDFCRCGDVMGTVEEIGLRSTRIRALDRTVVSIPNAEFAKAQIVNFARRDQQLFEAKIGIRFEASRAALEHLLVELRELIESNLTAVPGTTRVRFSSIGSSALEIDLRAYLQISDFDVFLAEKEKILLSVMSIVENAGCGFAFPSQTLYLTRDKPPALEVPDRHTREEEPLGEMPRAQAEESKIRAVTRTSPRN